ncbi:MAG: hypothetical protein K0Q74_394 [Gammaproteobacteria bacterium]|jgi:hypothetical protein|nr:hypothetical protein [Gammaproteobacteria bacterium]
MQDRVALIFSLPAFAELESLAGLNKTLNLIIKRFSAQSLSFKITRNINTSFNLQKMLSVGIKTKTLKLREMIIVTT